MLGVLFLVAGIGLYIAAQAFKAASNAPRQQPPAPPSQSTTMTARVNWHERTHAGT